MLMYGKIRLKNVSTANKKLPLLLHSNIMKLSFLLVVVNLLSNLYLVISVGAGYVVGMGRVRWPRFGAELPREGGVR